MPGDHIHRYFPGRFDFGGRPDMNIVDSVLKDATEGTDIPQLVEVAHFRTSNGVGDAHEQKWPEETMSWTQTSRPRWGIDTLKDDSRLVVLVNLDDA